MPIKTSGSLGFSTDIVAEFDGTVPHSISEYYRGGNGRVPDTPGNSNIPTTGSISWSDFYGAVNEFEYVFSSHTANVNLENTLTAAGWNGTVPVKVTVNSGIWVYGDGATGRAYGGMLIGSVFTDILTIVNNGVIAGAGGNGGSNYGYGENGGSGIYTFAKNVNITNNGYIVGGGGGGGGSGGGGGAGGGNGGNHYTLGGSASSSPGVGGAPNQAGTSGTGVGGNGGGAGGGGGDGYDTGSSNFGNYAGGGGGRILPGVGGAAGTSATGFGNRGPGGAGGSANNPGGSSNTGSGGGGGWAAAGGNRGSALGGSGGKAILLGGYNYLTRGSVNMTNNGTIYGAISA